MFNAVIRYLQQTLRYICWLPIYELANNDVIGQEECKTCFQHEVETGELELHKQKHK